MRIDFTVSQLRRAPAHYRFFAVGESVYFGDEEQIRRVNAMPADEFNLYFKELRQWCVSHGDFADARTAAWVAQTLNVGRTVARGSTVAQLVEMKRRAELAEDGRQRLDRGVRAVLRRLERVR